MLLRAQALPRPHTQRALEWTLAVAPYDWGTTREAERLAAATQHAVAPAGTGGPFAWPDAQPRPRGVPYSMEPRLETAGAAADWWVAPGEQLGVVTQPLASSNPVASRWAHPLCALELVHQHTGDRTMLSGGA